LKRRHRLYLSALVALVVAACGLDVTGAGSSAAPSDQSDARSDAPTGTEASLPPPSDDLDAAKPDTGSTGCGDTFTDPENCGECGHSCLGGACSESICAPEVLTDKLNGPIAVVLGPTHAYVAENTGGHIYRLNDAGLELIYDTKQAPTTLTMSGNRLYWGQQTSFLTTLIDGGDQHNVGVNNVEGILPDGDDVFCTAFQANEIQHRNAVLGGAPPDKIATNQNGPIGIAGNNTDLYWAISSGGSSAGIGHAKRDGGGFSVLVANEDTPKAIRIHDSRVFWTTLGAIRYFEVDGGTAAANLYGQEKDPRALAKSGTRLYWLSATTGDLRRGEMDGSRVVTLATGDPYRRSADHERDRYRRYLRLLDHERRKAEARAEIARLQKGRQARRGFFDRRGEYAAD
jgi:hypothetical protein